MTVVIAHQDLDGARRARVEPDNHAQETVPLPHIYLGLG